MRSKQSWARPRCGARTRACHVDNLVDARRSPAPKRRDESRPGSLKRAPHFFAALLLITALPLAAQPGAAKAAAPVDFTGYWVSIITEDWRWRMVTPIKGDFAGLPLNPEGRKIGNAWDPDKDTAANEQCRAYGAPAILRRPGRLHITWADDNTLQIDTDEGTQTRLLHFGGRPPANAMPSWQGYSVANWEQPLRGAGTPAPGLGATREGLRGRSLEVVTTQIHSGYLRKNGAPYSANTVLREFFDLSKERNGDTWFVVTTIVEDPQYLTEPFVTSTNFKMEPDGSKWAPTPCVAK